MHDRFPSLPGKQDGRSKVDGCYVAGCGVSTLPSRTDKTTQHTESSTNAEWFIHLVNKTRLGKGSSTSFLLQSNVRPTLSTYLFPLGRSVLPGDHTDPACPLLALALAPALAPVPTSSPHVCLLALLKDKSGVKWFWDMFNMITRWVVRLEAQKR